MAIKDCLPDFPNQLRRVPCLLHGASVGLASRPQNSWMAMLRSKSLHWDCSVATKSNHPPNQPLKRQCKPYVDAATLREMCNPFSGWIFFDKTRCSWWFTQPNPTKPTHLNTWVPGICSSGIRNKDRRPSSWMDPPSTNGYSRWFASRWLLGLGITTK